jgi:hypothetical protein
MIVVAMGAGAVLLVPLAVSSCTPPSCDVGVAGECGEGEVCVEGAEGLGECTRACAADLRCPQGQACIARDDGSFEGACLAITGSFGRGEQCTGDRDCLSGACLGEDGTRVCVDVCSLDAPCSDAADLCTLEGLRRVCAPPLDDRAAGELCASPSECVSGTCVVPPGQDLADAICVDNCSPDLACTVEGEVCVRLTGGARACLTPLADGVPCQASSACAGGFCILDLDDQLKCASACDDGACAEGFACDVDNEGNQVCMPVFADPRPSGETCESPRECLSGHCARFNAPEFDGRPAIDFGTLCADPCVDEECSGDLVCWGDPEGTDVCGPDPNNQ